MQLLSGFLQFKWKYYNRYVVYISLILNKKLYIGIQRKVSIFDFMFYIENAFKNRRFYIYNKGYVMTGYCKLHSGTLTDELIHRQILKEAEKYWEGSQAQKETIRRHIEMTGVDYDTAKKFYTGVNV